MIWDGAIMKDLPVRVIRASDRLPVVGVRVLLLTHETFDQIWALKQPMRLEAIAWAQSEGSSGVSDGQGRVTLHGQFPAGGRSSMLMKRGSYGIKGEIGVITETTVLTHVALGTLIPDIHRSLDEKLPEVELTLDRAANEEGR